jgi:hypothetical protein
MNRLLTSLLLVVSLYQGCTSDDADEKRINGENYTFLASGKTYRQALSERKEEKAAGFTILSVEAFRNDSGSPLLKITVSHQTDCSNEFEIIWDGSVMESFPARVNLLMRLTGKCNALQSLREEVILLDINELTGASDLPSNTIFHVINGSVTTTVNDYNVSSN